MTEGTDFEKRGKYKRGPCSSTSNSACTDLISDCTVLILHSMCGKGGCKSQKRTTFNPKQCSLKGNGFEKKLKKKFQETEKAWMKFLKHAVNVAAPNIGLAVGSKTKNSKVSQATAKILFSTSGSKKFFGTDMHGNGLWLEVM